LFDNKWRGKYYRTRRVEGDTIREDTDGVVITVYHPLFQVVKGDNEWLA